MLLQSTPAQSVPGQPSQPAAVEPAAMQPAALSTRPIPRPVAAPPSKQLNPGDLICGQCGEGNDPVRKFCSRCGQSLATATIASTPWWRRIVPHRRAKVLAAGERPGRRGGSGIGFGAILRIVSYIVIAVLLVGGIVYGAVPPFRDAVNTRASSVVQSVTGIFAPTVQLKVTSVQSTASLTGHDASRAVDGFKNTFWSASPSPSPSQHPTLTLGLGTSVTVTTLLFLSGDSAAPNTFLQEPRPELLHVVFSNGASQDITLKDTPASQTFSINGAGGVTGMTIEVMSAYPSTTGKAVSVTEVEVFGKR